MIYLLFTLIINIPIENNLKKGIRKYNKGKYNEAISILLKTESKNFEYFFYLGHSYSFNDRNELSIIYYDSAIYLNNKNDKAFLKEDIQILLLEIVKKH